MDGRSRISRSKAVLGTIQESGNKKLDLAIVQVRDDVLVAKTWAAELGVMAPFSNDKGHPSIERIDQLGACKTAESFALHPLA